MAEREGGTPWEVEPKEASHQPTDHPYRMSRNGVRYPQLWEHFVTRVDRQRGDDDDTMDQDLNNHLDRMSKDGWELVTAHSQETNDSYVTYYRLFWKRLI